MARTYRSDPLHSRFLLKKPKTKQRVKMEMSAVEQMKEEGFEPRPRGLANSKYSLNVPNAWDDYPVAAYNEKPKSVTPPLPQGEARWDRLAMEEWGAAYTAARVAYYKRCAAARQTVALVRRLRGSKSHQWLRFLLCYLR